MVQNEALGARLSRRGFLKSTAAVAGTAAIAGIGTMARQAVADEGKVAAEELRVTRCVYGGCFGCERYAVVRDGKAVNIRPKEDAPYGRRPCGKGYNLFNRLYSPERLQYPMRRVEGTERGAGEWERISWDEAFKEIAEKWTRICEEDGPQSIYMMQSGGGCYSEKAALYARLSMVVGMSTFGACADWGIVWGFHDVFGNANPGNMLNPGANDPFEEDVFDAKNIVVWCDNVSSAHLQRFRTVLDAQDKGAYVLAVDPNATQVALRSDKWLRPVPGSDLAVILACINVVFEEGLEDESYLKSDTVAPVLVRADTKKFLHMSDLGVAPIEGPVDMMTGQPTFIDPVAVWDMETGGPVEASTAINPAMTGTFDVNGVKVTTALDLLKEEVAKWPPSKAAELSGLSEEDIVHLARLCADGAVTHMVGLGSQDYFNGLQLGRALGTLVAVTGDLNKPGAGVAGLNAAPAFNTMAAIGPIMGIMNPSPISIPIVEFPDAVLSETWNGFETKVRSVYFAGHGGPSATTVFEKYREALKKVELVVVADVAMSDTAKLADLVLPVAHPFEYEGTYMAQLEAEIAYFEQVVEPSLEAKSDVDIAIGIAQALGYSEYFPNNHHEWVMECVAADPTCAQAGITYDRLVAEHTVRYREKGSWYANGYPTGTGRVEFYLEDPKPRMATLLPIPEDPEHLPTWVEPIEAWATTEAAQKYPLVFMYQRNHFRFHNTGFDGEWAKELEMVPTARINPKDAEARGIPDGVWVEFFNDRGNVVMRAYHDTGIKEGSVVYDSKGLRMESYPAGHPALLMQAAFEPYAVNMAFFDCTCEMRVWNGGE